MTLEEIFMRFTYRFQIFDGTLKRIASAFQSPDFVFEVFNYDIVVCASSISIALDPNYCELTQKYLHISVLLAFIGITLPAPFTFSAVSCRCERRANCVETRDVPFWPDKCASNGGKLLGVV
jgi:hypothetical protein